MSRYISIDTVRIKIIEEQRKLDNLINELISKKMSTMCDIVDTQYKKVKDLEKLLKDIKNKEEWDIEIQ